MLNALLGLLPFSPVAAMAWGWRRRGQAWDLSLGQALLAWALLLLAFSETTSLAGRLDLVTSLGFWALVLPATFFWASRGPRLAPSMPWTWDQRALLAGLGLILLFLATLGVQAPVANHDSMLYHLPRVEQWAQNRSLIHFPTSYDLQVFYPPWAEIAILQTRLLTGGTDWAPLVQVTALLGSFAGAACLARALGGGAWAALLAALAVAALPMANLEAPTSQNDLVCALWLIWAAVFTLRFHHNGQEHDALWAALALGLGLASKGTFYVFGLPWGLWLAYSWLQRRGLAQVWKASLLALLILAPNVPHWSRNHQASGTFLGSSQEHRIGKVTASGVASNVLKNLSYDALSTDPSWNDKVHWAVAHLHRQWGWNLDDPDLIWGGLAYGHYFNYAGLWHEDFAGNPWHLLGAAILGLAAAWGWRRKTALPWVLISAWAGYALYAAFIRYNPWCTRLHLPIFALLCAPLGLALEDRFRAPWRPWIGGAIFAYAAWLTVNHLTQPWHLLMPSQAAKAYSQSHVWRSGLQAGWNAAKLGKRIGILHKERELEQALWVGLRQGGVERVQHLNYSAATAKTMQNPLFAGFVPDVIIRNEAEHAPPSIAWGGRRWARGLVTELWAVYTPVP